MPLDLFHHTIECGSNHWDLSANRRTFVVSALARSGQPDFFARRWTAYELDGLVKLHAGSPSKWLDLNAPAA